MFRNKETISMPKYDYLRQVRRETGHTYGCNLCIAYPKDVLLWLKDYLDYLYCSCLDIYSGMKNVVNSMDEYIDYAGWDGLNIGMFTPIIRLKDKNQVQIEELKTENKLLRLKLEHERLIILSRYGSSITHP